VQIGRYRVTSEIARGGMGVVYRGRDPASGRDVALKVLATRLDAAHRERFHREGQVTASLRHPGILRVHDAGDADGRPFLVYELVDGGRDLASACAERDRAGRVELVLQAARALAHAHAAGVVHRDVKPDNVLVDRDGRVRVADFGLAAVLGLEGLTRTGAIVGTPHYMAPEQFLAERSRGPGVDVWALGVILYEALCGRLPFEGSSLMELAARIQCGQPTPPRAVDPEVPAPIEEVCRRALAVDPRDRYADAGAFARDLERAVAGEVLGRRPRRGVLRRAWPALPAVAAAGLLVMAARYEPAPADVGAAPPGPGSPAPAAPVASSALPAPKESPARVAASPAGLPSAEEPTAAEPPDGYRDRGVYEGWDLAAEIEAAARRGDPEAMLQYGRHLDSGDWYPRDRAAAAEWFRKAAEAGVTEAMQKHAQRLLQRGGPADRERAEAWLRRAAGAGHADSMEVLAAAYRDGTYLPQDDVKAADWLRRVARVEPDQGWKLAQLGLQDRGGVDRDEVRAALEAAGAAGVGAAWLELGICLERGLLGEPDPAGAAACWERVEAVGEPLVRAWLQAVRSRDGLGVPRDDARAVELLARAAPTSGEACLLLAELLRHGRGAPVDLARAGRLEARGRELGADHLSPRMRLR